MRTALKLGALAAVCVAICAAAVGRADDKAAIGGKVPEGFTALVITTSASSFATSLSRN